MNKLTLNNGTEMPALGFGVFQMRELAECGAPCGMPLRLDID